MPRQRTFDQYPVAQFWALVEKTLADPAAGVLIPGTPPQSRSLQAKFYNWRRAAEMNREYAALKGVDADTLRRVCVTIREDGCHFGDVNESDLGQRIARAIGHPIPHIPTPAERARALADRLNGSVPEVVAPPPAGDDRFLPKNPYYTREN